MTVEIRGWQIQQCRYTESGLELPGLDLASLATQGVSAGAQPNAYTGDGIEAVHKQGQVSHQGRCRFTFAPKRSMQMFTSSTI